MRITCIRDSHTIPCQCYQSNTFILFNKEIQNMKVNVSCLKRNINILEIFPRAARFPIIQIIFALSAD